MIVPQNTKCRGGCRISRRCGVEAGAQELDFAFCAREQVQKSRPTSWTPLESTIQKSSRFLSSAASFTAIAAAIVPGQMPLRPCPSCMRNPKDFRVTSSNTLSAQTSYKICHLRPAKRESHIPPHDVTDCPCAELPSTPCRTKPACRSLCSDRWPLPRVLGSLHTSSGNDNLPGLPAAGVHRGRNPDIPISIGAEDGPK